MNTGTPDVVEDGRRTASNSRPMGDDATAKNGEKDVYGNDDIVGDGMLDQRTST